MITEKQGFEAMLYMLASYWKLTDSNDLTDILSGGQYLEDGKSADPVFWEYWLEAIDKAKKEGPPTGKNLTKS